MKQFVFLIDTGVEKSEHKIYASGMTDALNRMKEQINRLKKTNASNLKIKFKGVIYENAY
ncbi:hypothetical protein [Metabacillus sediminilitoris]|jgi:hypothetical protein|uniref:Uncharacterized protein n=1 Tax=Metabacillus sediminilitoris TaxID=2567941 RepID=A0A4V6RXG3_9BACI|nr:hypothetical protein [Metabacillus sediminilitoris]QGQ45065.1 hypothetical protein GMB29_07185 [Metabacillus sediminilitoris]THF74654.1 hypothetical protein E6W99_25100 [Metabacillus sediminilitoris]